jgi:hypothetical protein
MAVNINRTNLSGRIMFLNNGQQLDRAKSTRLEKFTGEISLQKQWKIRKSLKSHAHQKNSSTDDCLRVWPCLPASCLRGWQRFSGNPPWPPGAAPSLLLVHAPSPH